MPKVNKLISSQKCQRCRHDKQKCVPEGRQWPGRRCNRCMKYDYACSANRTRSEEQSGGKGADLLVTQTPSSPPTFEPSVSQLLQELGDLRIMTDLDLEEWNPFPTEIRYQLLDQLDLVVSMLQGRAGQLTLEGNYRDAEHIYTHVLASPNFSEPRWSEDLTLIEDLQKLVWIYERTGNLSAAEAAQECLLRWAIDSGDYLKNKVTLEAKKLHHFYVLFYNRIRKIAVQHGDDQVISADFARMVVLLRVAALDVSSFNHLIELIEIPDNALHVAVTAGATFLTARLLHHSGCDVNTTDREGNTALHRAVRESQARMVQLLVEVVDLDVVNEEGDTALLLALNQKPKEAFGITKALLDKGSDIHVTDGMGRTALHLAVGSGTPDLTKLILSYSLEVDAPDFDGSTPLMCAVTKSASSNCVQIAQQLLESGANVNASDNENRTPLMLASQFGSIEMVQLLITGGANVDSRDCFSRTALHGALERTPGTEKEVISILIKAQIDIEAKDDDGRSPLGVALKRGDTAIARQLLEQGADVHAELEGESLLAHVVRLGNELATKLLLERGANVHTKDKQGETPLIVAVSTGRGSTVDVLLAHGADVEARDNKGETPLYIAVSQREPLILQALIRHGANVDSRNLGGSRPLDVAVAKADSAVVRVLLNNGANVSTLSQVGDGQIDPLLHRAIRNSDLATVKILLNATLLTILAIDLKGNTPIHQAILEGREPHERILDLLLERFDGRTEVFVTLNGDGDTPLHLAVRLNRHKMAESLVAAQSFLDASQNLCMPNFKGECVLDLIPPSIMSNADSNFSAFWDWRKTQSTL